MVDTEVIHLLDIKKALDNGKNIWDIPIRDKVLAIKEYKRLRQEDMAELLQVSRTYYGTLERGEHYNPKYLLGIEIDNMLLEIIYGEQQMARTDLLKQLSTLFKCVQQLKAMLKPGSEEVKYANMALKSTQIIAGKIKGKGEI